MRMGLALTSTLAVTLLAALTGCDRPAPKLPRVGFLGMDSQMQVHRVAAFQERLRALGYVEGRNISVDYRWAVHRILEGAQPADLPIEQPREFEFVINLKTASALGLALPAALRAQVTEAIQ